MFRLLAAFICAFALSAYAGSPKSIEGDVVGTWRWVSVNGKRVPEPFYIRYYANGTLASWPAPKSWSDSKGVSRGHYAITNGFLVLKTGSTDSPKSRIQIQKDQMKFKTGEGVQLIYQRVLPTVEPGRLENGAPAGYAKHPM